MKNIITYLLAGILSLAFSCSFAQESKPLNPKFRAAKMYVNSDFNLDKNNAASFVNLLRTFSPSIAWGREYGNFHEISAQDFGILFNDNWKSFRSTFDYSYNIRIGSYNPERKVNFYAGGGTSVGMYYSKNSSYSSSTFNNSKSTLNFNLVFTPRMTVKLGKRTFLDVNIPCSVYSTRRNSTFTDNPSVPVENRKNASVNSTTFPNQFTVRVGVAIKF